MAAAARLPVAPEPTDVPVPPLATDSGSEMPVVAFKAILYPLALGDKQGGSLCGCANGTEPCISRSSDSLLGAGQNRVAVGWCTCNWDRGSQSRRGGAIGGVRRTVSDCHIAGIRPQIRQHVIVLVQLRSADLLIDLLLSRRGGGYADRGGKPHGSEGIWTHVIFP